MRLHASGEDYLEAVLMLQQKYGMARSVDLARHMGRDGGFLTVDQDGFLHLTGAGLEAAEKIYERHQSVEQTPRFSHGFCLSYSRPLSPQDGQNP